MVIQLLCLVSCVIHYYAMNMMPGLCDVFVDLFLLEMHFCHAVRLRKELGDFEKRYKYSLEKNVKRI